MNTPRQDPIHRNRADRSRLARSLKPALTPVLALVVLLVSACGPSREELERRRTETLAALNATLSGEGLAPAARSELEGSRAWAAMREFYGTATPAEEAGAEGAEEAEAKEQPGTVWVDGEGPRETVDSLIAVLGGDPEERREALEKGEETVDPSGVGRLAELRDAAAQAVEEESEDMALRIADLELAASYAFLTRSIHTLEGRVDPRELNVQWFTEGRKAEPLKLLARVRDGADPSEVLADLKPEYAAYERLLEARDRYRAIVEDGGWKRVPAEGPALEEGARGPRVAALRQRLAVEGDLPRDGDAPQGTETAVYDATVAEAVERFQERVGIEPDGKIGPATLEELNVPAEERLRAIELNLERWRWMPGELGDHYIEVNIPEYRLRAVRGGETELAMNVIVGERLNQTPVFSDRMQYIVINPEWNIPESIADSEVVPKIVSNPGYAESQGIEVVNAQGQRVPASTVLGRRTRVSGGDGDRGGDEGEDDEGDEREERRGFFARIFGSRGDDSNETRGVTDDAEVYTTSTTLPAGYRLRQAPGPQNPLGEVKFMFPNEHNIYLHDTPGDSLFASVERGFSHGCIRLEKPLELADYVLRGDGDWNGERVRRVIASGERTEVRLPEEIPVHLTYFTAWVGEDGRVRFRNDLYGHDARLAEALAEEEPLMIDPAALRGA